VSQSAASRKATGTQLLALVGTTYVPLAGGTMTGALTIASGTLTASAPALNITQTWNAVGRVLIARKRVDGALLVNGSASEYGAVIRLTPPVNAAGSFIQTLQLAGVNKVLSQSTKPPRLRRGHDAADLPPLQHDRRVELRAPDPHRRGRHEREHHGGDAGHGRRTTWTSC
jgi:hypothetical protein